jgi:hypothetical protein
VAARARERGTPARQDPRCGLSGVRDQGRDA